MGGTRWIPTVDGKLNYDFSQTPTTKELRALKNLLIDFDIHERIPEFANRQQMHDWKKRIIKQRLA